MLIGTIQEHSNCRRGLWRIVFIPKDVPACSKQAIPRDTTGQLTEAQKMNAGVITRELSLATLFIMNSNRERYGQLRQDLENDFLKGDANFPTDMIEAQKLLTNYRNLSKSPGQQSNQMTEWHLHKRTETVQNLKQDAGNATRRGILRTRTSASLMILQFLKG